jgi:hypothetical protein
MASIRKEILIDAGPQDVWDAVRDWGALHERLVPGFVVDARLDGEDRIVTFANGMVAREVLVDLDDEARRLVWSMVHTPITTVWHRSSPRARAALASCGVRICCPTSWPPRRRRRWRRGRTSSSRRWRRRRGTASGVRAGWSGSVGAVGSTRCDRGEPFVGGSPAAHAARWSSDRRAARPPSRGCQPGHAPGVCGHAA